MRSRVPHPRWSTGACGCRWLQSSPGVHTRPKPPGLPTSGPLMSLHSLFQVYHPLTPQHPRGTQGRAGGPDASLSRKSGLREVGIYARGSTASQHSFHTTLPAPSAWRPTSVALPTHTDELSLTTQAAWAHSGHQ